MTTIETEPMPPDEGGDFAAEVAARVTEESDAPRKRGRPKGSKNAKKEDANKPTYFVANVTPGDVEVAATLGATIWGFVAPIARVAPLTPEQEKRLGEALAPLVQKYLPMLGPWQYEIAAVVTIASLALECKRNYVPPKSAEEIEADKMVPAVVRTSAFDRG